MRKASSKRTAIIIHTRAYLCVCFCVCEKCGVFGQCILFQFGLKLVVSKSYLFYRTNAALSLISSPLIYKNTLLLSLHTVCEQQAGVTSNNRMTGFNTSAPCRLPLTPHLHIQPHPQLHMTQFPVSLPVRTYIKMCQCVCCVFCVRGQDELSGFHSLNTLTELIQPIEELPNSLDKGS